MSWPQWPGPGQQQPPLVTAAAPLLNPAPAVLPPGMPYNPTDQWAQMQQQNWQQWAQWQQQYQQWHQQYGAEYQKSMTALAAQPVVPNMGIPPPLPVDPQPPLPKDDGPKPPLPGAQLHQQPPLSSYSTQPPLNNFSAPPPNYTPNIPQQTWRGAENSLIDQKRPLIDTEESSNKRQMLNNRQGWKAQSTPVPPPQKQAPPLPGQQNAHPTNTEELSEAEKKFDKQFAEWESQFNKWKDQNSGHPDKQQYKEYEKKWEQWRQQLLDRREAMRKKRLSLTTASNKPPSDAPTSLGPGGVTNAQGAPQMMSQNAQHPHQNYQSKANLPATAKQPLLPTPSSMFDKPAPDMNDEPLQFKRTEDEPDEMGGGLGFLSSTKSDGIPGLDLVKEGDGDEDEEEQQLPQSEETPQKGPDLEALSKGINNILGDQKLMSMLSMVSQNQNTPLNTNVNTTSRIHDVPPNQDQSNQSMEDTRLEHLMRSETVQNFDDQTRSSFTMQPNEPDFYRGVPPNSAQFNRGGPHGHFDEPPPFNRFNTPFGGPSEDDYRRPPPLNHNRFGRGTEGGMDDFNAAHGPPMNRNAGQFDRAPPGGNFDRGPPMGNFDRGHPGNTFDRAPPGGNLDRGFKGQDNFPQRGPGMLEGPGRRDNFGPPSGAGNFNREFNRGLMDKSPLGVGPGGMAGKSLLGPGPGGIGKSLIGSGPGTGLNRDDFGPPGRGNARDNFGPNRDQFNSQMDESLNRGNFNGPPGGPNRDRFGPPGKAGMLRDNFESNNMNRDNFGGRLFGRDNGGNFGDEFDRDYDGEDNDYGNDDDDNDDQYQDGPPRFGKDNFGKPSPGDRFDDGFRGQGRGLGGPLRSLNSPRDNFSQMPPNMRQNEDPGFDKNRMPPRGGNFGQRDGPDDRFPPPMGDRLGKGPMGPDQGRFDARSNLPHNRFGDKFGAKPGDGFNCRDNRGPGFRDEECFNDERGGNFRDERVSNFREERGANFRDNFDNGNSRQNAPPPPPLMGQRNFMANDDRMGLGPRKNSFGDSLLDAPAPPDFSGDRFEEDRYEEDMPFNEFEQPSGLEFSDEDIWKPDSVVDYEHKSLNPPEMEVLVQPFRMFDYRHIPLRRIPYPDRPNWLSDAVRMIPDFDPPIIRSSRLYEDRFEHPPKREERDRFEMPRKDDRRRSDRDAELRFSPPRFSPPRHRSGDFRDKEVARARQLGGRNMSRSPPPRFEKRAATGGNRFGDDREEMGRNRSRERHDREPRRDYGDKEDKRKGNNDWESDEDKWKGRNTDWDDENENRDKGGKNWKSNREEEWRKKDKEREERGRQWEEDDMDTDDRDRSRERELKYRNRSRDTFGRKSEPLFPLPKPENETKSNITLIEDLLNSPGRSSRPPRMVIILRGPPGSGKTYLAKLIKDKEVENGGSAPRILSLDDYFMVDVEKEVMEDGKKIRVKEMIYEYEAEMEESYRNSFMKSFKKTITDGYFPFIIVDDVNDKVKYFGEMWSFAKQNGFQVYVCQLDLDVQTCFKRNIHNRTEDEIRKCVACWENTPSHHSLLDASVLLQDEPIREVEMEEVDSPRSNNDNEEGIEDQLDRSKWDNFDCSLNNLARLDGVNKPLRASRTMEEYLQLDDEWEPTKPTKPGQKRVRWADLEECKQQEKMRAIGFVVGQTDWDRMMDPTMGGGALTQTKYIENVKRRRF